MKYKNKRTREEATLIRKEQNYYNVNGEVLHRRFIEDSLDWEKVIEKDYEVLSLINTYEDKTIITYENGGGCYNKTELSTIYKTKEYWIECFTKSGNPWEIYSIKRLSDSAVFTLGDKVMDSLTDEITGFKSQVIKYFNRGEKMICQAKSGTTMPLSTIRKVIEPVFTTHDNIDIYGNEKLFMVTKCLTLGVGLNFTISDLKDSNSLFFAKKENAEKYIQDNKPKRLYTEDEMVRALENWGMCRVDISYVNKFLNK